MDNTLIEKLKNNLLEEKSSLEKELENFASKDSTLKDNWNAKYPKKEENIDIEEEAGETQEYDNLISIEQSLELKLKDVNLALEKIKKESYGKCEKCGKEIEEERLLAYPEARLCISCNKQT